MMRFKRIDPKELEGNVFDLIGERWMLITAGDRVAFNTMTASWGGLGVLWGMPVSTTYVRPSRYTYEFMESGEYYTLSFYSEAMRPKLVICGSKSGRDMDKAAECGLTPVFTDEGAVYFEEAEIVLVCKKLYYNDLCRGEFVDKLIEKQHLSDDCHRLYIGAVLDVLVKED